MEQIEQKSAPTSVFWSVRAFHHHQRVEPRSRWWLRNRERGPWDSIILQYALSGHMVYEDRNGRREVPAEWMAMFAPGEDSAYGLPETATEPFITEWIFLRGSGLREHFDVLRRRFGTVVFIGHRNPLRRLRRQVCDLARPTTAKEAAESSNLIHRYVMRLYAFLEGQDAQQHFPVDRAMNELLRYPTHPWSLKEVAARHGCSREHLTRVFTTRTGHSPAHFLTQARLKEALQLLGETTLPLDRVAEQAGFVSKHNLRRWVRKTTGLTPVAYRRKHGG